MKNAYFVDRFSAALTSIVSFVYLSSKSVEENVNDVWNILVLVNSFKSWTLSLR